MSDVRKMLSQIDRGEATAAEHLLPAVYHELRRLAAAKLRRESEESSLQPTGLVHEAFLRLVDVENRQPWHGHRHFFAAAAEAMRRILIERARRRRSLKRGGAMQRVDVPDAVAANGPDAVAANGPASSQVDLLDLEDALQQLAAESPEKAELVKLRFFAGLSLEQAAEVMQISRATASRFWTYARAFLYAKMQVNEPLT